MIFGCNLAINLCAGKRYYYTMSNKDSNPNIKRKNKKLDNKECSLGHRTKSLGTGSIGKSQGIRQLNSHN